MPTDLSFLGDKVFITISIKYNKAVMVGIILINQGLMNC